MNIHELTRKAARLGFREDETPRQNEANQTLAEVVQSHNTQLWEAFPAILIGAAESGEFSLEATNACLQEEEKKYLKLLVMVSLGLYDELGLSFPWRGELFGTLPARLIANFGKKAAANAALELGRVTLQPERLRQSLKYLRGNHPKNSSGASPGHEEAALTFAMAQIFTERQKGLLLKRLNGEKLNKTETEYFSRVIKKKVRALANEDLHRLARRVLE